MRRPPDELTADREAVFTAIAEADRRGDGLRRSAIIAATGLPERRVVTALRRLLAEELIFCDPYWHWRLSGHGVAEMNRRKRCR